MRKIHHNLTQSNTTLERQLREASASVIEKQAQFKSECEERVDVYRKETVACAQRYSHEDWLAANTYHDEVRELRNQFRSELATSDNNHERHLEEQSVQFRQHMHNEEHAIRLACTPPPEILASTTENQSSCFPN